MDTPFHKLLMLSKRVVIKAPQKSFSHINFENIFKFEASYVQSFKMSQAQNFQNKVSLNAASQKALKSRRPKSLVTKL